MSHAADSAPLAAPRPPYVARLTPAGTGAVATILFAGPLELLDRGDTSSGFAPRNGRSMSSQPINRILFGTWGTDPGEDVVVCRVAEDEVEIHCHGGMAAVQRILEDLTARGCTIVEGATATQSRLPLFLLEWEQALARTMTERTAHLLLAQKDVLPAAVQACLNTPSSAQLSNLDQWLNNSRLGLHLTSPWQVVLTGKPNVGKSSLMNALLGYQRSIVYDQPGTTRDVVTGTTAIAGWPIHLSDTAGLRDTEEQLEREGVRRARATLKTADLVLLILDQSAPFTPEDLRLIEELPASLLVANKGDLPPAWDGTQLPRPPLTVSASTGTGLDELMRAMITHLVPTEPDERTPLLFTPRQVAYLRDAREALAQNQVAECVAVLRRLFEGAL